MSRLTRAFYKDPEVADVMSDTTLEFAEVGALLLERMMEDPELKEHYQGVMDELAVQLEKPDVWEKFEAWVGQRQQITNVFVELLESPQMRGQVDELMAPVVLMAKDPDARKSLVEMHKHVRTVC